jgi:hypothetical protein
MFSLASMHNLDVCAADVRNTFLYRKTKEKVVIKAGPEFGKDAGVHPLPNGLIFAIAWVDTKLDPGILQFVISKMTVARF